MVELGSVVNRACSLIRAYNREGIRLTLRRVRYRLASEQVGHRGLRRRLVASYE